jgi:hypothetical protein
MIVWVFTFTLHMSMITGGPGPERTEVVFPTRESCEAVRAILATAALGDSFDGSYPVPDAVCTAREARQ